MKVKPNDEFDDNPDSFMPLVTNVQSLQFPELPARKAKRIANEIIAENLNLKSKGSNTENDLNATKENKENPKKEPKTSKIPKLPKDFMAVQTARQHQVFNPPSNTNKKSLPSVNSLQHQAQALTLQLQPQLQQKVQIVRSVDGKMQVRGLLPGQQLARMPDGKLIIFSKPQPQKQVQHAVTQTLPVNIAREEPPTIVAVPLAPGWQAPPGANVFNRLHF